MPGINITVKNKIARSDGAHYVCGNSDFVANFKFDSEWDEYETKTARFSYNGSYVDVAFDGDQCPIPIISDTYFFLVGVYAGNLHTTTPARVPCKKSILCGSGSPADPTESVYNQLMEKLNDLDELSDEELAAAIDAYFAEHPVEQQPLRFTGATNATYDGSEAVEVFIPRMDANEYDPAEIITAQFYTANSLLTKYVAPTLLAATESMIADGAETVVSQRSPSTYALGGCITQLYMALASTKSLEGAKKSVENGFTDFLQLLNGGYITLPFIVHYGITSGIDPNTRITIKRMRVFPEGVEAYSIAVQYGDSKLYMQRYDSVEDMLETTRDSNMTVNNYYFTVVQTPYKVNECLYSQADSGKVLTVNDNGVIEPQALESLTVTIKGGSDECTADKTFDEILQAVKSGRTVWGYYEDYDAQLDVYSFNDEQIVFVSKAEITPFLDYRDIEVSFVSDGSIAIEEQEWPSMSGATESSDGQAGLVPAPKAGEQDKFLSGAGAWEALPISDWALAEKKPTYTAQEVGAAGAVYDISSATNESIYNAVADMYRNKVPYITSKSNGRGIESAEDALILYYPNSYFHGTGYTTYTGLAVNGNDGAVYKYKSMVEYSEYKLTLTKLTDIVDNLTTAATDKPLSANQGKALNDKIPWAVPQLYGAVADGTTDDTAAIQSALANNRYVYIPAGTYKLSGTLDIRDGCRLELAPDAILNFTQTSGNCITLGMSAQLNGNFATLVVPYAFSGNVIYISTASSTTLTGVPPYTRWTPQWKPARYVSDICITKPDSRGFHYSIDGNCSGTAVYIEADGSATSTFIWGARLSGLRIAGAFSYGVHGKCLSEGWNHEMHLEAVIDACEIGVCLEDSNNNYITATIQPRAALTTDSKSVPYAKHGIQLIRCRNTDLSATRVWDWNATNALWTEGGEYQHIAMVGNCSGTILSDFLYYETSYDIRSLIYTDTASNFEKMTILQEPFTRWFKPSEDGLTPYFYNGTANKELLQKDAFDALFQVSPVANFTNKLPTAATADGSVYNSVGYKNGVRLADADGTTEATLAGNTITGFIPCAEGDIIRLKGISFATNTYSAAKVYLYKSDHTKLAHVNHSLLTTNGSYYNIDSYEATDEGCSFRIVNGSAAYFRLSVDTSTLTADPVVTVNEEITYSQAGFLADSVSVKASSVYGLEDYIKAVIAANG